MTDTNTAAVEAPQSWATKVTAYNKLCEELEGVKDKQARKDALQAELRELASSDFATYNAAVMEAARHLIVTREDGDGSKRKAHPKSQVMQAVLDKLEACEDSKGYQFELSHKQAADGTKVGGVAASVMKEFVRIKAVKTVGKGATTRYTLASGGKEKIQAAIMTQAKSESF